jgi:muconolactone delta-isomerase
MLYFVKAEFIEENNAGKPMQEIMTFIENTIAPSLEALEKAMQAKKVSGGLAAGERQGYFIIEASSHEEIGEFLRSLPFWAMMKWTVVPLQSPRSANEQDKASIMKAKAMLGARR